MIFQVIAPSSAASITFGLTIATSIIPTFVRRRMVAFPLVALAEMLVAFIGFGVWVHHMFAVGLPQVTTVYFAAASLIIGPPSSRAFSTEHSNTAAPCSTALLEFNSLGYGRPIMRLSGPTVISCSGV